MFAGHHKLDNLCVIVDYNGLQIDGPVSEVGGPEPFDKKFEAFGFEVITVNGNDFDELEKAFAAARACKGKPFAIIAKTTKARASPLWRARWAGTARPPTPSSTKLPRKNSPRTWRCCRMAEMVKKATVRALAKQSPPWPKRTPTSLCWTRIWQRPPRPASSRRNTPTALSTAASPSAT